VPDLLAAVKGQEMEGIAEVVAAGIRHIGENRVQEAQAHWESEAGRALRAAHPDICLHLIGPLQTNKAVAAVALFDVIETVDRPALVDALAAAQAKTGRTRRYFIQVNTGEEAQKGGVAPADLPALLAYVRGRGLDVAGLMCIPPVSDAPAPHFALLAKLAARHGLNDLSMGMSGDYALAAQMGATQVRAGSAIFGPRLKTAAKMISENDSK
jgi:hypothetical protein